MLKLFEQTSHLKGITSLNTEMACEALGINFTLERLFSGMNWTMIFELARLLEAFQANSTLERSLVCGNDEDEVSGRRIW